MGMNDTSIIDIIELHPQEIRLIRAIREKYRFGDVMIKVRDGLPFRLERVIENVDLTAEPKPAIMEATKS